jgi:hypothetical protein
VLLLLLSPLPSCIKPFRKEQRHEMAAEGKRILVQKQDQCLPHRINPFRIEQKQEITAKNIAGNSKGSSRKNSVHWITLGARMYE